MPWPNLSFTSGRGAYDPVSTSENNTQTSLPLWSRIPRPTRPRWFFAAFSLILLITTAYHFRTHPIVAQIKDSVQSKISPTHGGSDTLDPSFDQGTNVQWPTDPEWISNINMTDVDWSRFAYTQYVVDIDYLCNSLMLFEKLHRLGSKADRVMMYNDAIKLGSRKFKTETRLLTKARDRYKVKLEPVKVLHKDESEGTWADSFTKLMAFNQTQYDRVLNLDSDSTILQNMDELFFLPSATVAMPRAYWGVDVKLSSQLLLIEPSAEEFGRIIKAFKNVTQGRYDMEIVNDLYADTAMIIPHRGYDLLTGEFRASDHKAYLGNANEVWEPHRILAEAKFLHFSDWPVSKPWIKSREYKIEENQPACVETDGVLDCENRNIWLGFYKDFADRRSLVCGLELKQDSGMRRKRGADGGL